MSQIFIPSNDPILTEVLAAYEFPATLLGAVRYGQGHINDTFCVLCQPQEGDAVRFILQGLSSAAFPHPEELMENFIGITSYLREKVIAAGGDPRVHLFSGEKHEPAYYIQKYITVITLLFITVYISLMKPLGFILSTIIYLFAQILLIAPRDKKKPVFILILSVVVSVALYAIFVKGFSVILPAGILSF